MVNKPLRKLFGDRLREIRKSKNLSQEKLAEKSNIHDTSIGLIERAEVSVLLDTVEKLAKGLEVETDDLFLFASGRNTKLKNDIMALLSGKTKNDLEKIIKVIKAMD